MVYLHISELISQMQTVLSFEALARDHREAVRHKQVIIPICPERKGVKLKSEKQANVLHLQNKKNLRSKCLYQAYFFNFYYIIY